MFFHKTNINTIKTIEDEYKNCFIYGVKRAEKIKKFIPKEIRLSGLIDREFLSYNDKNDNKVIPVEAIKQEKYDYIYISSVKHANEMLDELYKNNVPVDKIIFPIDKKHGKFQTIVDKNTGRYCFRYINKIIKFDVFSESDIRCYEEVFRDEAYKSDMPEEDTIYIDFGMNIGAAALYFAQYDSVKRIYGFEPFPDTFKQAEHNIAINDETIRSKFLIYDYAISDESGEKDIEVYREYSRTQSILVGEPLADMKSIRTVHIKKKQARQILEDILSSEIGKKIILKIDVEGSEYGIFENIKATDILKKIDRLIIEYHRGIMPLLKVIDESGFSYRIVGNNVQGFIFGVRS